MRKIIYGLALLLLFNIGLFANHGRVILDITYDEVGAGATSNVPLRLISYYDRHAATLDYINGQFATIKMNGRLNGVRITNIRATEPIMDKDGNYSLTMTYDQVRGSSNMKYTITDLYNPTDIAKNDVLSQVETIRLNQTILGIQVSNLKIGDLQTVPGGFRVDMTYDTTNGQSNQKYHIDEFYDAKKKAYDYVEDQLLDISIINQVNGVAITNLKEGPITEVPGGYSADITYDQVGGSSNVKYNIDEFYDAKIIARDFIHDQIQDIINIQKVNNNDATDIKAGAITEDAKNGKFTATITYTANGTNQKLVIDSYYDPIAKATNNLNQQLQVIKTNMTINGTSITNLRVGKIQVL